MKGDRRVFFPAPSGESVPFQQVLETPLNSSSAEAAVPEPASFKLAIDVEMLERAAEELDRLNHREEPAPIPE